MLVGKAVLLTLAVERNFRPLELAIGVAERASAVLPSLRRLHALGVAKGASVLDLASDLLLVVLAQTTAAVLDVVGEIEKTAAVFLQLARHRAQSGKGYALAVR